MQSEVQKHVDAIFSLIYAKDDLAQIIYDIPLLAERIGYKVLALEGSDDKTRRKALILKELERIGSEIMKAYCQKLLTKNDMWLFEPNNFKEFCDCLKKTAEATAQLSLTTAVSIDDDDLQQLCGMMTKKMGKKVVLDIKVDQSILGGVIIKKDSYILDYSIKTKLANLAEEWKESIVKVGQANNESS